MPQSLQLRGERGSILAGVLALSVAMTAVAGGYLLMAGNTASHRHDALDDLRVHYAAEGGALLGMRWLKEFEAKYYVSPHEWTEPVKITKDDFAIDNIKVEVIGRPYEAGDENGQPFRIESKAKTLDGRFTFGITWGINSAENQTPYVSKHATDFWIESYQAAAPEAED